MIINKPIFKGVIKNSLDFYNKNVFYTLDTIININDINYNRKLINDKVFCTFKGSNLFYHILQTVYYEILSTAEINRKSTKSKTFRVKAVIEAIKIKFSDELSTLIIKNINNTINNKKIINDASEKESSEEIVIPKSNFLPIIVI